MRSGQRLRFGDRIMAYETGRDDARRSLPKNPPSWLVDSPTLRDQYRLGYRTGLREVERETHDGVNAERMRREHEQLALFELGEYASVEHADVPRETSPVEPPQHTTRDEAQLDLLSTEGGH